MSEIKTVQCDGCGTIVRDGEIVTIYLRTAGSPWFGERHDYCKECTTPLHSLFAKDEIDRALAADRRD